MIERDLEALVARDSRVNLENLAADVWAREALHERDATARNRLAAGQFAVIVCVAFLSAGAGAVLAAERNPGNPLSPGERYAPSVLLFGNR